MGHGNLRVLRKTRRSGAWAGTANRRLRMTHKATVSIERRPESNQSGIVIWIPCERVDGSVCAPIHAGQLAKNRDGPAPECSCRVRLAYGIASALVAICICRLVGVTHRRRKEADSIYVGWAGCIKELIANRAGPRIRLG